MHQILQNIRSSPSYQPGDEYLLAAAIVGAVIFLFYVIGSFFIPGVGVREWDK